MGFIQKSYLMYKMYKDTPPLTEKFESLDIIIKILSKFIVLLILKILRISLIYKIFQPPSFLLSLILSLCHLNLYNLYFHKSNLFLLVCLFFQINFTTMKNGT